MLTLYSSSFSFQFTISVMLSLSTPLSLTESFIPQILEAIFEVNIVLLHILRHHFARLQWRTLRSSDEYSECNAQFVFSNDKRSVNALERSSRCVVEPHFKDADTIGNTKVNIITKDVCFKQFVINFYIYIAS